jgi:16S rRNA (cytosine1402-N4)-methyltransferase
MTGEYHIPVLLKESVEGLNIRPGGIYVDATLGGGGHAAAILRQLTTGRLLVFEQDEDAWPNAPDDERCTLVRDNFRNLAKQLAGHGIARIDGLLADLGVSSHQLDTPGRGFSFREDAAPDMRMHRGGGAPALDLLQHADAARLRRVLKEYGELKNATALANALVRERNKKKIETVNGLLAILKPFAPRGAENKFYARVFQALRIEVNDELGALRDLLAQAVEAIAPGGRLAVISYHSLEDRLVKRFIRTGDPGGREPRKDLYGHTLRPFREVNRKPIAPGDDEVRRNPRARSARLRVAERA